MTALITLEDYKKYKKLTKTDSDEELGAIISSVSSLIKNYCGHSFIDYYTESKTEVFNIKSSQHAILLNEWPVKTVSLVEYRDSYDESYATLDSSEYYVDTSIDTIFKHSGFWPEGFGSVKVTYTAGYASTPEDIKIAALDLVHHYHKEEYKERKSIGNASIDTGLSKMGTSKWPPHVSRVLELYRNG
ncbi:MAG: hypothetical protein ACO387_03445 [Flavobacteriaceae bacterium]